MRGFTRSTYPDIPGYPGAPCWTYRRGWVYFDADWNTSPPFGACLCIRIGPQDGDMSEPNWNPGFTLDLNAPLGEPNRLYLFLGHWHVILGLPEFRDFERTGVETGPSGRPVIYGRHFTNWLHPHIAGCDRYRYTMLYPCCDHCEHAGTPERPGHGHPCRIPEPDSCPGMRGTWFRNPKPAPLHWGWLTITKRKG